MNNKIDFDYSAINTLPELLELLHKEKSIPKNLYWRFVERYQERKARERGVPLYGQFELTPLCNLDCKMCYVHLDTQQMKGNKILPASWWKNTIQQAHDLGMMHASLTGGECLTHPEFDDIYMFLRSLGITINIKTNGILLDQNRIAFFEKYPPREITVSLYGSCNEAYKKVTGHAAFDAVYANLLSLKNTQLQMTIAVTPSRYMYDDIADLIEKVKALDVPFFFNVMLFPPREETGRQLCDISNQEYIEIYKMLHTKGSSHIVSNEEKEKTDSTKHRQPLIGIKCGAGRSSFNISWDGKMTACENLDSNRISLFEHSFHDTWRSIYEEMMNYPLPIECSDCKYNKVCFNCVAYRSISMEKGHCNPYVCERTKLLVKEGLYNL